MSVYRWLVVLVLLFAVLLKGNVKGNKKYVFVAFLLLFCVMALRDAYSVGNDSASSYLVEYKEMGKINWEDISGKGTENQNIGFQYLLKALFVLTKGNYQLAVVLISAFTMFSYGRFVGKYSPSPVQSILYFFGLLLYTFVLDSLKQSVAMSILLFSVDAIFDRKLFKFVLLVLFASWFHFPALIFLPAYFIANMKMGRSYIIVLVLALVLTFLFRDQLLEMMTDAYSTVVYDSGMRFLANKVIVMIVIVVAALVLRPPTPEDKIYTGLLQLIGIAVVLQTFASYNNTFERLADYYFHLSIVFIPMVFEKCDLQKRYFQPETDELIKTWAPILFCGFAIWRFLHYLNGNQFLTPYLFWFQSTAR